MASLIGTGIHQRLQQIQDLATQCSKDLQAVPSPGDEHDGRLANVNAQLEEALERYATQSTTDQSDLRKRIVGYSCELEQLEASYMAEHEDAEVAYNGKLEEVWESFCQDLMKVLGETKMQEILQKPLGKKKGTRPRADTSYSSPSGKRKYTLGLFPPRRQKKQRLGSQDKTSEDEAASAHPIQGHGTRFGWGQGDQAAKATQCSSGIHAPRLTAGEVYLASWGKTGTPSAVLLLPTERLHEVGVPSEYTMESLGLVDDVPSCYIYEHRNESFRWREGYEDGGPFVSRRYYPVIFFNGSTFLPKSPGKVTARWVPAEDLRVLDITDSAVRKLIGHASQVRKFLSEREKALAASNAKSEDGVQTPRRHESIHTVEQAPVATSARSPEACIRQGGRPSICQQRTNQNVESRCGGIPNIPAPRPLAGGTPNEEQKQPDLAASSSSTKTDASTIQNKTSPNSKSEGAQVTPSGASLPDHILQHAANTSIRIPPALRDRPNTEVTQWVESKKTAYAKALHVMDRSHREIEVLDSLWRRRAQAGSPLKGQELQQYHLRREQQWNVYANAGRWMEDFKNQFLESTSPAARDTAISIHQLAASPATVGVTQSEAQRADAHGKLTSSSSGPIPIPENGLMTTEKMAGASSHFLGASRTGPIAKMSRPTPGGAVHQEGISYEAKTHSQENARGPVLSLEAEQYTSNVQNDVVTESSIGLRRNASNLASIAEAGLQVMQSATSTREAPSTEACSQTTRHVELETWSEDTSRSDEQHGQGVPAMTSTDRIGPHRDEDVNRGRAPARTPRQWNHVNGLRLHSPHVLPSGN